MLQQRTFGTVGIKTSLFGIGTMRLPLTNKNIVDEDAAISMLRKGIDEGVTYIDTAYVYHEGQSETIIGKALQNGYRDKVLLTTKLPIFIIDNAADMEKTLDEQLRRLQTDCIDFYLFHSLGKKAWERTLAFDGLSFLDRMVQKGKIRFPGFSFHDSLDAFKEIIDGYPWKMAQIQINIIDTLHQAGMAGLHYAGEKGIPVVAMEPLRGGRLVNQVPAEIQALYDDFPIKRRPVEWAFRFLAHQREIVTILSGVSSMAQLNDNIRIFSDPTLKADCMTKEELELMAKVREKYFSLRLFNCTACGYCQPCPNKVAIAQTFAWANNGVMFNDKRLFGNLYREHLVAKGHGVEACIQCGLCSPKCPQHLDIPELLQKAHDMLTE